MATLGLAARPTVELDGRRDAAVGRHLAGLLVAVMDDFGIPAIKKIRALKMVSLKSFALFKSN